VRLPRSRLLLAGIAVAAAAPALASGGGDPVTPVILELAVILVAAKLGAEIAVRVGQPAVLGELAVGVLLGNLHLAGVTALESMKTDVTLDILARLGVLLLLFEVGLESTVQQMLKVGKSAFVVATLGVVAPFALGWGVGVLLLPGASGYVHAFLGATLCATSVGITARVLQDLGRSRSPEARIILGAAVIDDVLGLVVLAVVAGVIAAAETGGSMSLLSVGAIVAKSAIFLFGSLALGVWLAGHVFRGASRLRTGGVLLALGLALCFGLSWASAAIGLAPIVGAFAAGLILEEAHFVDFRSRGEHGLEELVKPIVAFLAPLFFVLMGMHTDLAAFANPSVLGLAGALCAAAIVGKQACALGAGPGVDRLTVGIGMIPRGEVGLIFANLGLALTVGGRPLLDSGTYSAIVIVVLVTTLVTPPALRWSLARRDRRGASSEARGRPA
jgi:Kef-type K+ transport system membrane component KefB